MGGKRYVWDFHCGKVAFPPLSLPASPLSVAFSFDESRLAVLCSYKRLRLIGRSSRELPLPILEPRSGLARVFFRSYPYVSRFSHSPSWPSARRELSEPVHTRQWRKGGRMIVSRQMNPSDSAE
jgi:hypothetical protein